jgi:hypothetical protein
MLDLGLKLETLQVQSTDPTATALELESVGAASFCDVISGDENRLAAEFSRNGTLVRL